MPIQPAYLIYGIVDDERSVSTPEDKGLQEIRYKDIAAVVREVEVAREEESNEERLRDWLVGYQQTNIDLFQNSTLLPVRFATTVGSKEELQDFLAAGYLHIKIAMAKVKGKAEFVVHLFWDVKAVLEEIYRNDEGLWEGRNLIETGRMLFQATETRRKETVDAVHRRLSAVAVDSSEAKRTDESMIMNQSYLIERTAEGLFDEMMADLGRENPSYLRFKYTGPLPPCSFVPLEFRRGNFDLIDWARRMLSLPDRANFGVIKAAYRTLSLRYHPDRNPDDPGAEERFREITEAYKIVETYCLSCGMAPSAGEDPEYSLVKDEVDRVFIVC
ncbi:MAG: GvpL/GvpF family gas vesicle protein [Candidatus Latescibacteria bacterium]|nr:GvpL/GvpF family gas vesicle protein [Candidatus Latescibacterota bacterium]